MSGRAFEIVGNVLVAGFHAAFIGFVGMEIHLHGKRSELLTCDINRQKLLRAKELGLGGWEEDKQRRQELKDAEKNVPL